MKELVQKIFKETGVRWVTRRVEAKPEVVRFLERKYPGLARVEQIYLYLNGLEIPRCPVDGCRNIPRFFSFKRGYAKTCSTSCQNRLAKQEGRDREISEKIRATSLLKYGVENAGQSAEAKKKRRATNLRKYGVSVPVNTPEGIARARERLKDPQVREKIQSALFAKHGVSNSYQIPHVVENARAARSENFENEKRVRLERRIDFFQELSPGVLVTDITDPLPDISLVYESATDRVHFRCKRCDKRGTSR